MGVSRRSPFCALPPEIEAQYTKKMQALREELDLRRKTEVHEVEERKNNHINELMRNHEKAFNDIKSYYNDITLNNLALISSLKVLQCPTSRKGLVLAGFHPGLASSWVVWLLSGWCLEWMGNSEVQPPRS